MAYIVPFSFIPYSAAALTDHFLKLIAAPTPWMLSTVALNNLAESIPEITAAADKTGRTNIKR